jgi:transposase
LIPVRAPKQAPFSGAITPKTPGFFTAKSNTIAPKIGCVPQTLLDWVKRDEIDKGQREGLSSDERERLKALEREVKELRRANDILKTASAFFAQAELDRRLKS